MRIGRLDESAVAVPRRPRVVQVHVHNRMRKALCTLHNLTS